MRPLVVVAALLTLTAAVNAGVTCCWQPALNTIGMSFKLRMLVFQNNICRLILALAVTVFNAAAQGPSSSVASGALQKSEEFFEMRVRPVLAKNCFTCHTST